MPSPITLDRPCPVCGGHKFWDNSETKKSPKHPDYKCANKECRDEKGYAGALWKPKEEQKAPQKPQEPAGAPKGGRLTPDDTTPDERGERVYTWEALCYTYGKLYASVHKTMNEGKKRESEIEGPFYHAVDESAIQAAVATLLIQGKDAHIPLLHPRKAVKEDVVKPAKPPVPEHIAEEFEEDWP